ncbi:MAG TPA: hypothetical protein VEW71_08110 [Allosphingosinicella sp.]|nr:hypothetical protein [Allosphingosinicella sp.]
MLALVKTILLAAAALIAAAALCALFVLVYPAFGFPLFALAAAELIWLIVALLAIPMALLDRQRDWRAMALVPLSLVLMTVFNTLILSLAASRSLDLDPFTANIIGLTGNAARSVLPFDPDPISSWEGPIAMAALGLVSAILTALLLRARPAPAGRGGADGGSGE